MRWKPAASLLLSLALSACAEGGGRGSGIFASVLGNVTSMQTAARTDVEGIRVRVAGTGAKDQTDANGNFAVAGDFEGMVNLVFQLPNGGGEGRMTLNVPAGGTLTLNNVRIDTQQEVAIAETQAVDFEGTIAAIDCRALTLTMVSIHESPGDVDQYVLRLDTSSVRDPQGNLVPCEQLRDGEEATVRGFVNPDGTFGDATVQLLS